MWAAMRGDPGESTAPPAYVRVFGALLALDRGRPTEALVTLGDAGRELYDLLFASWHAALAAETAVLADDARVEELLRNAHAASQATPIPALITRRALALRRNDHTAHNAAAAFAALGAPTRKGAALR